MCKRGEERSSDRLERGMKTGVHASCSMGSNGQERTAAATLLQAAGMRVRVRCSATHRWTDDQDLEDEQMNSFTPTTADEEDAGDECATRCSGLCSPDWP